ncbi:MAG: hypothetical protein K2I51_06910, partial [Muribaculaceae bacterium]|nr:hypothetical protein [Muribaculaceae bacterium]
MARNARRNIISRRLVQLLGCIVAVGAAAMFAWGQTSSSLPGSSAGITPPPPFPAQAGPLTVAADSIMMPFPVQQTVPQTYEELMRDQFAADLTTPSNVKTEVE